MFETAFLSPEEVFEELLFFSTKSSNMLVVFRLWGKFFGFLVKVFWLGCQNCFQVSTGRFWKNCFLKTIFSRCFNFFGLRAGKLQTFVDKFSTGSTKLHSMCPEEIFEWTVSSMTFLKFFYCFWAEGKNILEYRRKNYGRFVKTAFFVYKTTFWWKCVFRKKILQFVPDLTKSFAVFCQKDFHQASKKAFQACA